MPRVYLDCDREGEVEDSREMHCVLYSRQRDRVGEVEGLTATHRVLRRLRLAE